MIHWLHDGPLLTPVIWSSKIVIKCAREKIKWLEYCLDYLFGLWSKTAFYFRMIRLNKYTDHDLTDFPLKKKFGRLVEAISFLAANFEIRKNNSWTKMKCWNKKSNNQTAFCSDKIIRTWIGLSTFFKIIIHLFFYMNKWRKIHGRCWKKRL